MLLGCHIPVAGGYDKAAAYAADVGCECIQIFAKSPRMWRSPSVDHVAAERFALRRAELGLGPLFVHTAYLINLGSADDVLWQRSIEALADELSRARTLRAEAVVTHIGTRCTEDTTGCADRVAEAIARAHQLAGPQLPRLLLENTAGAGRSFGGAFGELGVTLRRLESLGLHGLGVCLDTCHAHAHGIDLSSQDAVTTALDDLEVSCGTGALGLIHGNDSMFACGAKRDRHAWIGDGTIGYEGFGALLCEPRLEGVALVTEMPGEPPEKDIENLGRLRRLRRSCR